MTKLGGIEKDTLKEESENVVRERKTKEKNST